MPSLSDLRKSPDVGRPEQTFDVCLSPRLAAELDAADKALFKAEEELEIAHENGSRPGRMGTKSPVPDLERKAEEAAQASDAIRARMAENTITLHLRALTLGEWRQWVSKHPARDKDEDRAGAARDAQWAGGFCNIDDLVAAAGMCVVKYGDEDPTDGAWEFITDNAAGGELTRLASTLVQMHEQGVDLGKSRVAWRSTRRSIDDSE